MDQKRYKLERERINFQINIVQSHINHGNGNIDKPYTESEKDLLSTRMVSLEKSKVELESRMKRGY